ncbi:M23 family metallopeptidase [Streptomyces yaanensis]|uniref:M23 family metallopeptidase n=1 Tax=Streptomyces yaanensis TaxID=1142239 RepID=A0ABV7SQU8_9ACTN|nr:M23 family metallopeptidase [Streptomyces sp. CGMCC 4.7035]WNB97298.1 M23 family metallopeptidase [Streptomyces sp. CGMCC 4.7035]
MNDRHPSGTATTPAPAPDAASAHYASYGQRGGHYGEFATYSDAVASAYGTGGQATGTFAADPLFGNLQGDGCTGSYDATQWSTGSHQTFSTGTHQTLNYDPYAAQHQAAFDTGAYDTTAWAAGYQQLASVPAQAGSPDGTGQWDAHAWMEAGQPADPAQQQTQQWEWGTQSFDTGAYDATQWNSGGTTEHETHDPQAAATATFEQIVPEAFDQQATATFEQAGSFDQQATTDFETPEAFDQLPHEQNVTGDEELEDTSETSGDAPLLDDQEEIIPVPAPRAASRAANRSRRRSPAKRSALLTVAVPSVCVMGVAGIAAATVGVGGGESDNQDTTASAPEGIAVKPSAANNKLDSQLASLSAGANDFADRASRTQERIDLKAQQAAEKRKAAEEAARKERLRPKFALPVMQRGLSAYFGQAGVNWMSVHTGIDFPVSYGTTVMAATDGTVRTQWNSAYGNMMIVTAKDGTETWYCHLSSYRVASGTTVKAGDPIAYSGNSGNSTGPHLHFEVRPSGGSPIDPLPWLRSHGLNPT